MIPISLALLPSLMTPFSQGLQLQTRLLPDGHTVRVEVHGSQPGPLWLLADTQAGPARFRGLNLALAGSAQLKVIPLHRLHSETVERTFDLGLAGQTWFMQVLAAGGTQLSAASQVQTGQRVLRSARPAWPVRELHVNGATGSNSNPGTLALPWATIQHAADNATPGSRVKIASGLYQERVVVHVSGTPALGAIAFVGDPSGGTIVDGSQFNNSHFNSWSGANGLGLIDITDRSRIRLQDLEVRGLSTGSTNHFLHGITIAKTAGSASAMDDIELIGLNVHHIRYTGTSDAGGAQGVSFYGGNLQVPMRRVIMRDCEVHDLRLGQSESITFNGNIDGFRIEDCQVHDNDNIGISIIGWEGTAGGSQSEDDSDGNAHLYGGHNPLDQARNGVVVGNRVWHCSTGAPVVNPTYPTDDWSASGIYVDGGRSILIERNVVDECDLGISAGCEHGGVDNQGNARSSSLITIRNNNVSYCGQAGIAIGGYNIFRGDTSDSIIQGNTVYKCSSLGWAGGQININKGHNNLIANNILVARGPSDTSDYDGFQNTGGDWSFDHGVVLGGDVPAPQTSGNSLSHNLYFTEGGASEIYWKWEMDESTDPVQGLGGLLALDATGAFGDPLFINATNNQTTGNENFQLSSPGSPAFDSGLSSLPKLGRLDAAGNLRLQGSAVERGAYERQ